MFWAPSTYLAKAPSIRYRMYKPEKANGLNKLLKAAVIWPDTRMMSKRSKENDREKDKIICL